MSSKKHAGIGYLLHCRTTAIIALVVWLASYCCQAQTTLTVSAAASLKDALVETESAYKQGHTTIAFANNFGSSGTLAAQIDQGAPVDIFISAAERPMDDLVAKGLIVAGTRRNLLRNTLVLIAPLDSKLHDLRGLTDKSIRVVALGDPASVPAGQYGKQTLLSLRLWDQLNTKLVLGKDVRQVLIYVETGNADAGLVYATDAITTSKVRVITSVPESLHEPIVYPTAVVRRGHSETDARKFIEYIASPAAQAIFQKHGFTVARP